MHWLKRLQAQSTFETVSFAVSVRFETNLACVVFSAMAGHLASLHKDSIGSNDPDVLRGMVRDYLERPLPNGRRLLLVRDGADEAADWQLGPDLRPTLGASPTTPMISNQLRALSAAMAEPGALEPILERRIDPQR